MKKIRKANKSAASHIDEKNESSDIANVFANKYKDVFNSVSYAVEDMAAFMSTVNDKIDSQCKDGHCKSDHKVTIDEVKDCLRHLKSGKHDGDLGHYTDHLINGTDKLNVMILYSHICWFTVSLQRTCCYQGHAKGLK